MTIAAVRAALSIAAARRSLRSVPRRRPRLARARRARPGRPRARARSHRARRRSGRTPADRGSRSRSPRWRRAGSPASRSRASSARKEFWGLPFTSTPPRWCRGRRPKPWSKPRSRARRRANARARCASPISAPARARSCSHCCPSCRTHAASAPTSRRRRSRSRAQCGALGLAARATFVRLRLWRGAATARSISSCPTRPTSRAATSRGSRPRCATYDPPHALDGGADGLAAYRAIAADARRLLAPGGRLVVEIGAGQQRDAVPHRSARGACDSAPSGTICQVWRAHWRSWFGHKSSGDITDGIPFQKPKKALGMSQKTD